MKRERERERQREGEGGGGTNERIVGLRFNYFELPTTKKGLFTFYLNSFR